MGFKKYLPLFLYSLLLFVGCKTSISNEQFKTAIIQENSKKFYIISEIIDGDTYRVFNKEENLKVRLIGIDTPEISNNPKAREDADRLETDIKTIIQMGKMVPRFLDNYLSEGDTVWIEYDVQHYDRYNRTLGYVYLKDGRMINEILVLEGYAQVMTIPPNVKHQELFLKAQHNARVNNRGFWNK